MKETYTALKEFGASFLGPSLSVYARAVEQQADGCLPVCLAREGWLLHRLLTRLEAEGLIRLAQAPIYLRVSRTLLFRAMLGEPLATEMALRMGFEGTLLELLMKRFSLLEEEAMACLPAETLGQTVTLPDDADQVSDWLAPHASRFWQQVAPTREALHAYLRHLGLHDAAAVPLMLDLGYSGSIQKLCTALLSRDTRGLYFIASQAGKQAVGSNCASMSGVFREGVAWKQDYTLLDRSMLLECLMTAPHGQVVDIRRTRGGDFLFFHGREAPSQRYYQDLDAILEGAVEAVCEALRHDIVYRVDEVERLFAVFATRPGAIPSAAWHLFAADDDINGNGMLSPLPMFGI